LAQYNLGLAYQNGDGIDRDLKQAAKWYKLSAYNGDYSGQLAFADVLAGGIGVEKDFEQAYSWFKVAENSQELDRESKDKLEKIKNKFSDSEIILLDERVHILKDIIKSREPVSNFAKLLKKYNKEVY
ncbi:MAG: hypothetical protein WCL30_04415, partial [Pseudomonadota bacterium]